MARLHTFQSNSGDSSDEDGDYIPNGEKMRIFTNQRLRPASVSDRHPAQSGYNLVPIDSAQKNFRLVPPSSRFQIPKPEPVQSPSLFQNPISNHDFDDMISNSSEETVNLAGKINRKRSSTISKGLSAKMADMSPDELEEYLRKRKQNNIAVKKSRAKAKRSQVELEARFDQLLKENDGLKAKIHRLEMDLELETKKNGILEQAMKAQKRT